MGIEAPNKKLSAPGVDDLNLTGSASGFARANLSEAPPHVGVNLFWRTFFLLSVLLLGSVLAWLKTVSALEVEPRALQTARQVAATVKLTRAALQHSDPTRHAAMIESFSSIEGMRVQARLPHDTITPPVKDSLALRLEEELRKELGPDTELVQNVNNVPGVWVGFSLDSAAHGASYWLLVDPNHLNPAPASKAWLAWLALAVVLSLAGAALIARLVNNPIKQLWLAASRVRVGDYDSSYLDETASTSEIREVNIGFNRMAQRLSAMEQDRAIMLAGISHDLRTPLARLRLETELSVADVEARDHMCNDIEQLDRIIDKFLDYARPVPASTSAVVLSEVIDGCLYALANPPDMHVTVDLRGQLIAQGDATELGRVLSNLLENARRYGKNADGVARVEISGRRREHWILLKVRDFGPGVPAEDLPKLKQAFFRSDTARTAATGAGLGLAIVDKAIQRMGGSFVLTRPVGGGLSANFRLNLAQ
jgi:two-component system osmolarity sensor histidine kinase EnvZ